MVKDYYLDGKTGTKANVDIARKSFGSISGSFVGVHNNEEANITIIAEGLETALSVSQSLREHSNIKNITYGTNTLCSLGINNIKNYSPSKAEKIIIAADNDGENAITAKTIANAKTELQAKGAIVEIVKPEEKSDFNDVLNSGPSGSDRIANIFQPALIRHSTRSLKEYLASIYESHTPNLHDKHIENAMHNAYHNQKHGIDDQLDRLTRRITTTGMNQQQLCSVLKGSNNSYNALNTLTKRYHIHVMNVVHNAVKSIRSGESMYLDGKKFICEQRFVSHMIHVQRENEFFPKQNVQKVYKDITKQMDMSRNQGFSMSR